MVFFGFFIKNIVAASLMAKQEQGQLHPPVVPPLSAVFLQRLVLVRLERLPQPRFVHGEVAMQDDCGSSVPTLILALDEAQQARVQRVAVGVVSVE